MDFEDYLAQEESHALRQERASHYSRKARRERRQQRRKRLHQLTAPLRYGCAALAFLTLTGCLAVAAEPSAPPAFAWDKPVRACAAAPEAPEAPMEAATAVVVHVIPDCTVTHYDACALCCGKSDGITASGAPAVPYATCAVDPAVIPLGSEVLLDYGDGILHAYRAEDTGVFGNAVDVCVSGHQEALELGVRLAAAYWIETAEA